MKISKQKKLLSIILCLSLFAISIPINVKADSYGKNNNGTHQHSYSAYTTCGGSWDIQHYYPYGDTRAIVIDVYCNSCRAHVYHSSAGNDQYGENMYHCNWEAEAPRNVMLAGIYQSVGYSHGAQVWKTVTVTENCSYDPWSDWVVTVEPTCTTTGSKYKTRTCSLCGYVNTYTEVIPALGHIWTAESSEITTAPTPYSTGIRTFTCERDHNHKTTEIEPILQFDMFNLDARISKIYLGDILMDNSSSYNFTSPTGVANTPTNIYLNTN